MLLQKDDKDIVPLSGDEVAPEEARELDERQLQGLLRSVLPD